MVLCDILSRELSDTSKHVYQSLTLYFRVAKSHTRYQISSSMMSIHCKLKVPLRRRLRAILYIYKNVRYD